MPEMVWIVGWILAVSAIFFVSLQAPSWCLSVRSRFLRRSLGVVLCIVFAGILIFANKALTRHDVHLDLTAEHVFTPDPAALEVVRNLKTPVRLTYFFREDDPQGRRAKHIVEVLAKQSNYLQVRTVDPDKDPSLAQSTGVKFYNAALLENNDRQIIVRSTNETDIAIGIQRLLRERIVKICFMQGHGEYPSDNYEFHTHIEQLGGEAGHSHGGASGVVETTDHGVGRLRRSLEALGYEIQTMIPAKNGRIEPSCRAVIDAGPRTSYSPLDVAALEKYLTQGGSVWLMYDVGFTLTPDHDAFLEQLGVDLNDDVVIDPGVHYADDPDMVAITAYESHPITKRLSFTFFPGVRSITTTRGAPEVVVKPLFASSRASYAEALHRHHAERDPHEHTTDVDGRTANGPHLLAVAASGRLNNADSEFRVVVMGDSDFATNSFYPYMSNNKLAVAIVRWLVREDQQAAIASRIPARQTVVLTNAQQRTLLLLLVVGLPLVVSIVGAIVWWRRR